ncbi:MAG: DUF4861 domain-containing protein, partial [Alistipes sp.]|nr:DUF4861 domain-containing protein [Alistipes sp.]
MKRLIVTALLLVFAAAAGAKTRKALYSIKASAAPAWVVINDIPADARGATVYRRDAARWQELPSQMDDLDGDGRFDELVFRLETVSPSDAVQVRVVYSTEDVAHDYVPLVNAQMWWKNPDKTLSEKLQLSSDKDDMYHKLHHHGPAFESEYAAYRVYFDKKQSIDTYGKKRPALELRETMWYPSDEQLAAGFGHDNLRVFGSVSVGALKGWNAAKRRMEHIVDMRRREATIRARGPLRTVVDMRVEGWKYCGREVHMTSRYILYGGGSVVKVENRISGAGADSLLFTTGVMKIAGCETNIGRDGEYRLLETAGCDFPENDTLKWERETVYLAAWLPECQVVAQIDDSKSWLCQLRPADGCIDYWFV